MKLATLGIPLAIDPEERLIGATVSRWEGGQALTICHAAQGTVGCDTRCNLPIRTRSSTSVQLPTLCVAIGVHSEECLVWTTGPRRELSQPNPVRSTHERPVGIHSRCDLSVCTGALPSVQLSTLSTAIGIDSEERLAVTAYILRHRRHTDCICTADNAAIGRNRRDNFAISAGLGPTSGRPTNCGPVSTNF
jgi:hypothetical protein